MKPSRAETDLELRAEGSGLKARRGAVIAAVVAAVIVTGLYFWRIGIAPVYLAHDEVLFAVQAQSIATTLRDISGTFLPLYIHMGGNYWCSPEHIYAAAALLRFVHISDASIRVPSVLVGLLAVALMYFLARRLFRGPWYGLMAATFLALTPAHFLASRFKVESHYPLPFIIGWLLCLLCYLDTRRTTWLLGAGATLGFGIYSYHASPVMMPLYLFMTVALVLATADRPADAIAPAAWAIGGFALVALPFAVFVLTHPEYIRGEVNAYKVFDATNLNWWQGFREIVSWVGLTARTEVYWDYFNPSFLFFSGGASLIEATQRAGVFLLPFAVFLPVGIYRLLKREATPFAWLIVAGFLTAPVAAALVTEAYATSRILAMLPFATLIAAYGVQELTRSPRPWLRCGGVALLVAVPVCFTYFYADYQGDYRRRSAYWFENNIRGALESTIAHAGSGATATPIRISSSLNEFVEWDWKFYLAKHDRADLESRTKFFDPKTASPDQLPPGALIVAEVESEQLVAALAHGQLRELDAITEPTGNTTFRLWTKDAAVR